MMIFTKIQSELPEYKEITDEYYEKDRKPEEYRNKCGNEAFEIFSELF